MGKSDHSSANTNLKSDFLQQISELRARVEQLEDQLKSQNNLVITLRQNEEKYKVLLDGSSDPIFSFFRDGEYQYVNQAFAEGVNRPLDEIIHRKIWDVFPKEEADKRFAAVKRVFETGETEVLEVRVPRTDADRFYLTTAKPVFDGLRKVVLVICISKEITERKRLESELLRLSNFDALTGLYNRHYFEVELERFQVSLLFPVSIIILDLDKLKSVNDQFGHSVGDNMLQKAATVIQDSIRSEDIASRIGGDEFAIILPQTNEEDAERIVKRFLSNVHAMDDERLHLSIGYATGEMGSNIVDVFRLADERMYHNKRNGMKDR